jgi:hypothetical protein
MENLERFTWTIAVIITLGEVGLVPSFDGEKWRLEPRPSKIVAALERIARVGYQRELEGGIA